MNVRKLRAAAAAVVIGGVMLGATAVSAQTSVSSAVGRPLQEARQLADSGRYKEAMARLDTAAGAAKTPAENNVVNQMKQYVAVKSGDASIGGALGAKAKFAADAGAGGPASWHRAFPVAPRGLACWWPEPVAHDP